MDTKLIVKILKEMLKFANKETKLAIMFLILKELGVNPSDYLKSK